MFILAALSELGVLQYIGVAFNENKNAKNCKKMDTKNGTITPLNALKCQHSFPRASVLSILLVACAVRNLWIAYLSRCLLPYGIVVLRGNAKLPFFRTMVLHLSWLRPLLFTILIAPSIRIIRRPVLGLYISFHWPCWVPIPSPPHRRG